jgi:hypothetical protein
MVCFSGIACPLFNLDCGFYSIERKDKLIAQFPTLFSYSPFAFTLKDVEPAQQLANAVLTAATHTEITALDHL